jgi:hypothetical protein
MALPVGKLQWTTRAATAETILLKYQCNKAEGVKMRGTECREALQALCLRRGHSVQSFLVQMSLCMPEIFSPLKREIKQCMTPTYLFASNLPMAPGSPTAIVMCQQKNVDWVAACIGVSALWSGWCCINKQTTTCCIELPLLPSSWWNSSCSSSPLQQQWSAQWTWNLGLSQIFGNVMCRKIWQAFLIPFLSCCCAWPTFEWFSYCCCGEVGFVQFKTPFLSCHCAWPTFEWISYCCCGEVGFVEIITDCCQDPDNLISY